jgi:hypothetical protein
MATGADGSQGSDARRLSVATLGYYRTTPGGVWVDLKLEI